MGTVLFLCSKVQNNIPGDETSETRIWTREAKGREVWQWKCDWAEAAWSARLLGSRWKIMKSTLFSQQKVELYISVYSEQIDLHLASCELIYSKLTSQAADCKNGQVVVLFCHLRCVTGPCFGFGRTQKRLKCCKRKNQNQTSQWFGQADRQWEQQLTHRNKSLDHCKNCKQFTTEAHVDVLRRPGP